MSKLARIAPLALLALAACGGHSALDPCPSSGCTGLTVCCPALGSICANVVACAEATTGGRGDAGPSDAGAVIDGGVICSDDICFPFDGGSGSGAGGGSGGGEGAGGGSGDGPAVQSFSADPMTVTPAQGTELSALVANSSESELTGGQLLDANGYDYGVFGGAGGQGTFAFYLDWAALVLSLIHI